MMLFGAKLERMSSDTAMRMSFERWGGYTPGGAAVSVTIDMASPVDSHYGVSVCWCDGAIVHGFGPTFADAKRDCVRMLSERSQAVGRV